ncbi:RNA-binding protein [Kistimonas scapharcae]|uniref:RNA-binding protein n=1 Tax=Kistimonas scapharcae TaxID=1036133 RepID=A0ABP8VBU0_9GAMM
MQQNKLFVGNLAFSSSEQDLEAVFGQFGELQEVKIIMDRETGRSRGFGFVSFVDASDAEAALAANGQNVGGRDLRVNFATERTGGNGGRRDNNRGGFERRY